MKKIIVPVDFSYTSRDALSFALEIAPVLNSSVEVLHIYSGSFEMKQPLTFKENKGHHEVLLEDLHQFIYGSKESKVAILPKTEITYDAVLGLTERELIKRSKLPETRMIVMGTTGSHGITGKLFGTISTSISQKASCPVLLIPKGVTYKGFNNILFASNYESVDQAALEKLADLTTLFQASIHFVHVPEKGNTRNFQEIKLQIFKSLFKKGEPSFSFEVTAVDANSVMSGLNDFILNNNIDLTVMVSPRRNFWQKTLHSSTTRKMAFNTSIPLLVHHLS